MSNDAKTSLEEDMLSQGFTAQVELSGRWLVTQANPPLKFKGLLQVNPPIDPALELGADPREKSLLAVLRPVPPGLVMDVRLQDQYDGSLWKVMHINDNPAAVYAEYWLVKIVAGEDT